MSLMSAWEQIQLSSASDIDCGPEKPIVNFDRLPLDELTGLAPRPLLHIQMIHCLKFP
jgi:hypothetical protein